MHILVTETIFIDEFKKFGREHRFSRAALISLFSHLEECDDSEVGIELDVIGVCSDYAESTVDEVLRDYTTDIHADGMDDDEKLKVVIEWLGKRASVVGVNDGRIVFNCLF